MKLAVYNNYDELSKATADLIVDQVNNKPNSLLCFPSGESPTGTIRYLIQYAQEGKVNFSQCNFVGLDEWIGMDERNEGSCKHYLYSKLFIPLNVKEEKIFVFNATASDLDKECERMNSLIQKYGPLDIMLVGIGLNGHIGLNEPGSSFDSFAHQSVLDPVTETTAQKYFNQETKLRGGITLGLQHLKEAKKAVLIASGIKKAAIMKKSLEGEVSNKVPASIFQKLTNGYVFLDKEAASELSQHQPASI